MCSREIFTKKSRQQQNFDSDLKGAWHYNHVTFTPIAKLFLLYCRLIYMLSILCVTLTIKAKVGIPESFKEGWSRQKITWSSHLKPVFFPEHSVDNEHGAFSFLSGMCSLSIDHVTYARPRVSVHWRVKIEANK